MARATPQSETPAVIVAGPTGSGKSALALALAESFVGTVINADSMQVYREARVLTARPSPADEERAPHRLFGVLAAGDPCSAGRWQMLAETEIAAATAAGRLAILVGGSGLYIRALIEGLVAVPPIPAEVRQRGQRVLESLGGESFRAELAARDPAVSVLPAGDRQRLLRAWEVIETTGRPLSAWQRDPVFARARRRFVIVTLLPPRAALYRLLEARFDAMLTAGGFDEAKALYERGLDPNLPLLKAVGIRQLLAHVSGETGFAEATTAAKQATRRYAKRQMTWFRHQLPADLTVCEQLSESLGPEIFAFIRRQLLTHGD